MDFEIKSTSPRAKKLIAAILPSMIKQLKLESCKAPLVVLVLPGEANQGSTIELNLDVKTYAIIMKSGMRLKEVAVTLAHEMVHVKQLASGVMKNVQGGIIWCGKMYKTDDNIPYLEMPWEIQAFSRQEIIMRKAVSE